MIFSSKKVVGVDLGSSSIKLAQVSKSKGMGLLDNFALAQTPAQTINNGDITDTYLLGDAVKQLHKEQKFSAKNACIGMWGSTSIVKKISMPKVESKALREQIKYEAQQYLPFDISQVTLEHHVLPFSSSPDQMDILIMAGQNELITKYIEVLTYGNLKTSIIDVSSIALANVFEFNYGKLNEPVGIFNFGSNSTQFVVVFQGEILFARDIPVGGFTFTNEISKNMGITLNEAESLKLSQGIAGENPENTKTFINIAMENVTEEVRNSIDFYSASGGDFQISKAYYTGGASLTEGMIEHISSSLKINFEVLNPLIKIRSNNKKFSPLYLDQIAPFLAVSLGLALRDVGDT